MSGLALAGSMHAPAYARALADVALAAAVSAREPRTVGNAALAGAAQLGEGGPAGPALPAGRAVLAISSATGEQPAQAAPAPPGTGCARGRAGARAQKTVEELLAELDASSA